MSYLLDAIRKAEQQRNDDAVPTLEGLVQQRRARASRGRGRWLIWIALVIVIVASIYLNQSTVSRWIDQGRAAALSLSSKVQSLWQNERPGSAVSPEVQSAAEPAIEAPPPVRLTDAQRALIGQINVTVLSYSTDDNKRFIMVDGSVLREGDLLEGFEVRRIQQDGVVILVEGKSVLVRP